MSFIQIELSSVYLSPICKWRMILRSSFKWAIIAKSSSLWLVA